LPNCWGCLAASALTWRAYPAGCSFNDQMNAEQHVGEALSALKKA
jgi:hypothetical protein